MAFSTAYANDILKLITAKTKTLTYTGQCWLGFSSTTPTDAGENFTEPTDSSYERIQLNITAALEWTDMWGDVAEKSITNAKEIVSKECKMDAGWSFTHFGIFGSKTGGKPIAFDLLRDPDGETGDDGLKPAKKLDVARGNVAVFRVGTLTLTLT